MSDKGQTSSKHQKACGEKKKGKSGCISRNGHKTGGNKNQPKEEIIYTYEEYLESLKQKNF